MVWDRIGASAPGNRSRPVSFRPAIWYSPSAGEYPLWSVFSSRPNIFVTLWHGEIPCLLSEPNEGLSLITESILTNRMNSNIGVRSSLAPSFSWKMQSWQLGLLPKQCGISWRIGLQTDITGLTWGEKATKLFFRCAIRNHGAHHTQLDRGSNTSNRNSIHGTFLGWGEGRQ